MPKRESVVGWRQLFIASSQPQDAGPDEKLWVKLQPLLERPALPERVMVIRAASGPRDARLVPGARQRIPRPVLLDRVTDAPRR